MKLKRYIAVNLLLILSICVFACGWWPTNSGNVLLYRIIPLDETDYENYSTVWESDIMLHPKVDYKAENLRLWQRQTSTNIGTADIEKVVYKANVAYLQNICKNLAKSRQHNNGFIRWIATNKRKDILDLLILAKQIENVRYCMNDPWYYPVDGSDYYRLLNDVVERCSQYKRGPLLGRYALQMTRALCALREYKECAEYWDRIKAKLDNDVVKTMTELQAASALYKVNRKDEAIEIYARHGDVASIRVVNGGKKGNELEFVYEHNPNSPYLEGELQKWLICYGMDDTDKRYDEYKPYTLDDEKLNMLSRVANKAVKSKRTRKKAMWYYVLAAIYDITGDPAKAKNYLKHGQQYPKDTYLSDSYHVLRMWLDAKTATYNKAYEQQLLCDLKWLTQKIKHEVTPEIYKKLTIDPCSWREYDDDNRDVYQAEANTFYWNDALRRILLREVCPHMHKADKHIREIQLANLAENFLIKTTDHSGEMFVIMDRLSYKDTRDYFNRIYHPKDEFDRFLNERSMTDKYYWYDILATKCLRERRYKKAQVYLRQLPVGFQKKLNVYYYMDRQPFSYNFDYCERDTMLMPDYKLHFAKAMARYEQIMRYGKTTNQRAKAKIQYALGLRNSVNQCWTLTRYSSNYENNYIMYATPYIEYPEDTTIYRHNKYTKLGDKLIKDAINTFTDREQAAQELRKLAYYKRVMDEYGNTPTAKYLQQQCDRWKDYAWMKKTRKFRLRRY